MVLWKVPEKEKFGLYSYSKLIQILSLAALASYSNLNRKCYKMLLWLPNLLLWSFLIPFLIKSDINPPLAALAPFVRVSQTDTKSIPHLAACLFPWSFLIQLLIKS